MKRRIATTLSAAALAALALAACTTGGAGAAGGSTGGSTGAATSGGESTSTSGGDLTITYVQGVSGNPFFTSLTCGAQEAADELGVSFNAQGGQDYSPQAQTPVLTAAIAAQPDGILISPMAGDAMVAPLRSAQEAGIKLVFADSTAADESLAASFVSSDNAAGGALAATQIAERLGDEGGKVVVMGATPGISTTDQREQGFLEEIANYPNIEVLETQYSESAPATATSRLSAVIAANPDLAAVFAVSTQEVEGVSVSVQSAGLQDQIDVIGFDTSDPIIANIETGLVDGVVVQQPLEMGRIGVEQLVAAINGEATEAVINTDFVFLTADNMDDPEVNQYIYRTSCS